MRFSNTQCCHHCNYTRKSSIILSPKNLEFYIKLIWRIKRGLESKKRFWILKKVDSKIDASFVFVCIVLLQSAPSCWIRYREYEAHVPVSLADQNSETSFAFHCCEFHRIPVGDDRFVILDDRMPPPPPAPPIPPKPSRQALMDLEPDPLNTNE